MKNEWRMVTEVMTSNKQVVVGHKLGEYCPESENMRKNLREPS